MNDQTDYIAAPDHSLRDILNNIAPRGLAVPVSGDDLARHREKEKNQ